MVVDWGDEVKEAYGDEFYCTSGVWEPGYGQKRSTAVRSTAY